MRRRFALATLVGALVAAGAGAGGCARDPAAGGAPAGVAPVNETPASETPASKTPSGTAAGDWPAGVKEADVYVQVLRRYLGTPAENSFPGRTFPTAYVLDRAFPDAADPLGKHDRGTPVSEDIQRRVAAGLTGTTRVVFIADRNSVLDTREGCASVKDGGMLITLGPVTGDDKEVRVGTYGFVACLGATWLTYVVKNHPGTGWQVTGTTGSMAIA